MGVLGHVTLTKSITYTVEKQVINLHKLTYIVCTIIEIKISI